MLTLCKDELPNPYRNCITDILSVLICHDNDYRRTNLELRKLKDDFKRETKRIELKCRDLKKAPSCDDDKEEDKTSQLMDFTTQIKLMNEVNTCFSTKIEKLKEDRKEIIDAARKCFVQLNAEKIKFKEFHEKTVEHLKIVAIRSDNNEIIETCEKDITEIYRLFIKEVHNIKKCEEKLDAFYKEIAEPVTEPLPQCDFTGYDWIPHQKKYGVIDETVNEIRNTMGGSLRKAFAQMHIHRAKDPKIYLAAYLLNSKRNEALMEAKYDILGPE